MPLPEIASLPDPMTTSQGDRPVEGRGGLLTCGDVEENPGPRGPRGRGRGRGRPRSDTSDEDYALRADLVAMACATFGVSPTVDAFASAANARFPVF